MWLDHADEIAKCITGILFPLAGGIGDRGEVSLVGVRRVARAVRQEHVDGAAQGIVRVGGAWGRRIRRRVRLRPPAHFAQRRTRARRIDRVHFGKRSSGTGLHAGGAPQPVQGRGGIVAAALRVGGRRRGGPPGRVE